MKLYKSCKTLSIARFFRIFETDDYRNLIIGFDIENDELTLNEVDLINFEKIFNTILYEYSDLTNNIKVRTELKKKILIQQWQIKYDITVNCIDFYLRSDDEVYLDFLNKVDSQIDLKKPIIPQLNLLINKMKGLKNKIKIFKINLAKSFKESKTEIKIDLDKEAFYLEKNLELKREIDPETTTVSKWVKINELNSLKMKENGNVKH